ncbi:RidA family protein [Streptomyces arenae]|nr:RidA family protein [Streptomyces arenae]
MTAETPNSAASSFTLTAPLRSTRRRSASRRASVSTGTTPLVVSGIVCFHCIDNVQAVLGEAGMSLAHLVRLNVYTTDADLLFRHYGVLAGRLGAAGVAPATTMLEVTRLAIPGQLVELEGTAVA